MEIQNVTKKYKTGTGRNKRSFAAVNGVNISVERGQCVGLVGESGCGKTTLARLILGIERLTDGSITFQGVPVGRVARSRELRRKLQMVYQDSYDAVNYRQTITEIIGEPLVNFYRMNSRGISKRVDELLASVDLPVSVKMKYPRQLSMGQLQRVCIARALAASPELIVLDEPLSSLDVSVQAQILNKLSDLKKSLNISYLLISHDLEAVYYLSDAIYVMYGGRIMESIQSMDDFEALVHPYSRKLLASCPAYRNMGDDSEIEKASFQTEIVEGCPYAGRCSAAITECFHDVPEMLELTPGHMVACHKVINQVKSGGN
ncbi:MAG: oligopeptide/dipeptide ABC transporter ATP-binding protein [Peptococcaceae bacterium]